MSVPNVGQVIASVWENVIGSEPTDNIFESRALFYALGKSGFKQSADGGRLIEFSLEYAENTTNQMIGEMDTLDTTRIDVFDAARYDWKIAAGTVVFSDFEKLRVQASSGKFDLIEQKLENGRDSHIDLLNDQLNGAGTGSNDIDGIQKIISTTPTTGTVGGINAANFSFWRNRQNSGAKTTTAFDNLRSSMTTTYNQCSLGGVSKAPTAAITTRTVLEGYESGLVANARYMSKDRKSDGDQGFMNDALMFKGIPVFYDEAAVASELRFINPKFLKVVYLKNGWMKMKEPVEPANQLTQVYRIETFCNLTSNARRHLGVVSAIS